MPENALYLTSFYVPGRSTPVKGKQGRKENRVCDLPGGRDQTLKGVAAYALTSAQEAYLTGGISDLEKAV